MAKMIDKSLLGKEKGKFGKVYLQIFPEIMLYIINEK